MGDQVAGPLLGLAYRHSRVEGDWRGPGQASRNDDIAGRDVVALQVDDDGWRVEKVMQARVRRAQTIPDVSLSMAHRRVLVRETRHNLSWFVTRDDSVAPRTLTRSELTHLQYGDFTDVVARSH